MGQHGGVAVGTELVFAEFGDGVLRQAPYGGRDGVPETGADAEQLGAGFQNPVGVCHVIGAQLYRGDGEGDHLRRAGLEHTSLEGHELLIRLLQLA